MSSQKFAWSQKTYEGKIYFEPCFQLFKKNELGQLEKRQQVYIGAKEGEAISAIRNTVIHNAENLRFVPTLELISDKDSTMDQELANCNKVYDIAAYIEDKFGSRSRSTMLTNLPTLRFDSSLQKRMEAMKQVDYVNYTLNNFKELSQILGEFMSVENCKVQQNVLF